MMEHDYSPEAYRGWADALENRAGDSNLIRLYRRHADLIERHAKLEAEHADALRALKAERERAKPNRHEFNIWYAENAFDYKANPIGSRECDLQWAAWKAALAAQEGRT